jgi:rhomboid protease GluP
MADDFRRYTRRHIRSSRKSVRALSWLNKLSMTNLLIIINVIAFIIIWLLLLAGVDLSAIGIQPSLIVQGENLWTLFTSIFSHVYFYHLFFNMFSLFFIGNFLEKIIGRKRLFWIFIIAGLFGSLFFVASSLIFGNLDVVGLGASGAVFGILGMLAVLVPRQRIYLIVGPLIVIILQALLMGVFPQAASTISLVGNVIILFMIFAMFSFATSLRKFAVPLEMRMWLLPIVAIVPLVIVGFFVDLPIGNSAHIGGLVAGLIYAFYLRKRYKRKTSMISKYFSK